MTIVVLRFEREIVGVAVLVRFEVRTTTTLVGSKDMDEDNSCEI